LPFTSPTGGVLVFTSIADDVAMATEFNADQVIRQVSENLQKRFPDISEVDIRTVVTEEIDALRSKPVIDYVAVLGERNARKRLKKSD
jgi:hypothetical protein